MAKNETQTKMLAETLAKRLIGGEVIELIGDIGAGKTTFVKYLVAGLQSEDPVSSPTFTVSNVYHGGRLPVHHFDFYRLGGNDELIKHELAEYVEDKDAVKILEWANSVKAVLPEASLKIEIFSESDDARRFIIDIPEAYSYLEGA